MQNSALNWDWIFTFFFVFFEFLEMNDAILILTGVTGKLGIQALRPSSSKSMAQHPPLTQDQQETTLINSTVSLCL